MSVRRGGLLGLLWLLLAAGCTTREVPQSRFEFERPEMGLPFRLVLYAADGVAATNAAEAAFARISDLNAKLSDYEAESELSRLSRTAGSGQWVPLSGDLAAVLIAAEQVSRASDGAFDVTVGPEVLLWRRARRQRAIPPADQLAAARAATGWTNLVLRQPSGSGQPVEANLLRPGMRLDLGGIAKGYALDEAGAVLRARGVRRFLISGGGDMYAGEAPPGQPGWRVEVGVFDTTNRPAPSFVSLRNAGLATSGDAFQRAEIGGVRYSHIVNPHTGLGLTDHSLVTVIAPTAMTADALSTAISVLGPERGLPLAASFRAEVLVLRQPAGRLEEMKSPGFARWLEPVGRAP